MATSIPGITLAKFTTFGDLLRFLRRRAGITQLELAIAVGYGGPQISRLEQNQRLPDLATIEARFVPALYLEEEPHAVARLLELATQVRREDAAVPGLCPYKGLNYFDEGDTDFFVGREALTAKLVDWVLDLASGGDRKGGRFLAIVGASGSGKSSLVRAGLIPALRWDQRSADWQIHTITPTARPLENLALDLMQADGSVVAAAALIDDLARRENSLHLFIKRSMRSGSAPRFVLVVDQFEELFALCRSEAERKAFIDNLITASRETAGPIMVVITLRADFYAHCAAYPELREALALHQEYIGTMTMEDLRRVIEEPARRGRWETEPGLVDLMLRDVGQEPGALPLLSHALLETWERRRGHTMTLSGYTSSGGVRGAIAETAESVFVDQFTPEQQAIARRVFLRLTELGDETAGGDTRRRASVQELILKPEDAESTQGVLKALSDARLIVMSEESAEVAHEALIREWPTLRGWLEDNREGLRLHRQLTEAAQEWNTLNRDPDMLYRGARLSQAREWAAMHVEEMNALENEFLECSVELSEREIVEREAQRQRELEAARKLAKVEQKANTQLRRRAYFLVGALAIALVMGSAAWLLGRQARASFVHADALRLASEANKLIAAQGNNADLIALLGLRSMSLQYSPQADGALVGAMSLAYPVRVFTGSTDDLWSAAFSPDGKYVVTGGADKIARLWDVQTGRQIRQFTGFGHYVTAVAFSPDGKVLATASYDQTLRLWDPQTGQSLGVINNPSPLQHVAFTPDGKYIITGSGPYGHQAWLWDLHTRQIIRTFSQSTGLYAFDVSRDGRYLLTGGKDDLVHLWDVQTGSEVRQFSFPVSIDHVAFSPDGQTMLVGGRDTVVRVTDLHSGQTLRTFAGHDYSFYRLGYSPDGKYILYGGVSAAHLLDAQTLDPIAFLTGHEGAVFGVFGAEFSPDGRYIFTAGSRIGQLWETDQVIHAGLPQFVKAGDPIGNAALSPDGNTVAITHVSEKSATIWDLRTRQKVREFGSLADYVGSLAFSPDGKYLLASGGNQDNTVRLWDVQTGQEVHRFTAQGDRDGEAAAFSPDGKYIAGFSDEGHLWDVQSGREIRTFIGHSDRVNAVAFSPDGRYVLSGSGDDTARLWDAQTGQQVLLLKLPAIVDTVTFSPDGKRLLTGSGVDSLMRLWDATTGKELREFAGHSQGVWRVAFSADGRYALSAGGDGTARLWDVATGAEVRRFVGHTGAVTRAAFSPDGKYVMTGADDGAVRLWFTDYHAEIQYLCARLPRDFTADERRQYNITDNKPTCPKP